MKLDDDTILIAETLQSLKDDPVEIVEFLMTGIRRYQKEYEINKFTLIKLFIGILDHECEEKNE